MTSTGITGDRDGRRSASERREAPRAPAPADRRHAQRRSGSDRRSEPR